MGFKELIFVTHKETLLTKLIEELLWIVVKLIERLQFRTCKFEAELFLHLVLHHGNQSDQLEIGYSILLCLSLLDYLLSNLLDLIYNFLVSHIRVFRPNVAECSIFCSQFSRICLAINTSYCEVVCIAAGISIFWLHICFGRTQLVFIYIATSSVSVARFLSSKLFLSSLRVGLSIWLVRIVIVTLQVGDV